MGLVDHARLLRNIRLTDRRPGAERFRRLWHCVERDELLDDRDRDILLLLGASGPLPVA